TGHWPDRVVNVNTLKLNAESPFKPEAVIEVEAIINIFGPGISCSAKADITVVATFNRQLLYTCVSRATCHRRQLRPMAHPIGNRDRRIKGDSITGDRRYSMHFISRMIGMDLEVAKDVRRTIVTIHRRIVNVPNHPIIWGCPNLLIRVHTIGPPPGTRSL